MLLILFVARIEGLHIPGAVHAEQNPERAKRQRRGMYVRPHVAIKLLKKNRKKVEPHETHETHDAAQSKQAAQRKRSAAQQHTAPQGGSCR